MKPDERMQTVTVDVLGYCWCWRCKAKHEVDRVWTLAEVRRNSDENVCDGCGGPLWA